MKFIFIGLFLLIFHINAMEKSLRFDIKEAHDSFLDDFLYVNQYDTSQNQKQNTLDDISVIQKLIQTKTSPHLVDEKAEIDYEKAILMLQKQLDAKDEMIVTLQKELEKTEHIKLAQEQILKTVLEKIIPITEKLEHLSQQKLFQ